MNSNLKTSVSQKKISELVDSFQGPATKRYQEDSGTEFQVIQVRNLEFLGVSGELSTAMLNSDKIKRYQVEQGDVLVSSRGAKTLSSVVSKEFKGSTINQNLLVLRPNKTKVQPSYLASLLRSDYAEHLLAPLFQQSNNQRVITLSQIRDLTIPLPSIETQTKLAKLFEANEEARRDVTLMLEARTQLADHILLETIGLNAHG